MENFDSCNVTFTFVHASNREEWYFDRGCYRHIAGNSTFFSEFKECSIGHVTFGDGVKRKSSWKREHL